jgi:hypothetical protein
MFFIRSEDSEGRLLRLLPTFPSKEEAGYRAGAGMASDGTANDESFNLRFGITL